MMIIHGKDKYLLAEVTPQGELKIHNDSLKNELKVSGIPIPDYLKELYGNKRVVEWEDPDFKKAFIEIYFPNQLRESGFIKA